MKNLTKLVPVFVIVFLVASPSAFATTATSGPYTISASVDGTLTMSVALKKNSSTGAALTSMDFGKLVDIGTGTLRSSATSTTGTGNVTAMISANSHALPYVISQTGTVLSNGVQTLPSGACTVVPGLYPADNGGAANVGTVGTAGTWVATGKTLYTSNATGDIRTIQAAYSVTDDSAAGATTGVPLNQASGTYNGSVTFTVTA
jgi:hypothetical protein